MSQIHLACGLPSPCSNPKAIETKGSIGLRITAIVLGVLATVAGVLILLKVLGISHLNAISGWTVFSIGIFLSLGGASMRCVHKPHSETAPPALESPSNDLPAEIVSRLPKIVAENLKSAPYFVFKTEISIREIKEAVNAPLAVFSTHGGALGVYAKVRVEHEAFESSPLIPDMVIAPKVEPFFIDVMFWRRYTDDDLWVLSSDGGFIRHKNENHFPTTKILGNKFFTCTQDEDCKDIATIERHDQLPSQHQRNLVWVLERLFHKGFFKMSADHGHESYQNHDPCCGYWRLSLA